MNGAGRCPTNCTVWASHNYLTPHHQEVTTVETLPAEMGQYPLNPPKETMFIRCQFVTPPLLSLQTLKKVGRVIVLQGTKTERDDHL